MERQQSIPDFELDEDLEIFLEEYHLRSTEEKTESNNFDACPRENKTVPTTTSEYDRFGQFQGCRGYLQLQPPISQVLHNASDLDYYLDTVENSADVQRDLFQYEEQPSKPNIFNPCDMLEINLQIPSTPTKHPLTENDVNVSPAFGSSIGGLAPQNMLSAVPVAGIATPSNTFTEQLIRNGILSNQIMQNIPPPTIQNVVASANLGCSLNLETIARKAKNAEYHPKRFPGVTLRIREPRTTASVFGSGKLVCTGGKSEEFAKLACRKYARIIQSLGFDVQLMDFKVNNVVASFNLNFCVSLEDLQKTHSKFCSYEPEMFPGLIYRMLYPRTVLLIFVTGKVIIVGAKNSNHVREAHQNICPTLAQFPRAGVKITP